jgi:hypothetical protein
MSNKNMNYFNSTFQRKPTVPLKRSGFKQKLTVPMKRGGKLRVAHHSETNDVKQEIQDTLRAVVIERDGGCILRHYSETGACGGYRKDGQLILQAEHLHTRSNSASFADSRLVICLCRHHHGDWKPQHADEYYQIVRRHKVKKEVIY